MVKISKKEYGTLKSLDDRWIWIARDSGDDYIGQLFAYLEKLIKSYDVGCWRDYDGGGFSSTDSYLFQFIQWSDSEPYNIAEPLGDMTSDIVRMTRDKEVAYQFTDEKSIATHLDKIEGTEAVKVEEMEESDAKRVF